MSTKINVNQFKQSFCTTLEKDKQGNYFKVYVDDYQQLALLNYYLVKSIKYVSQSIELNTQAKEVQEIMYSIEYLTKLIEATDLLSECEGIDNLSID